MVSQAKKATQKEQLGNHWNLARCPWVSSKASHP